MSIPATSSEKPLAEIISVKKKLTLAKAIAESLKIAENEKSVQDAFASDLDKSTDCTSDAYLARLLQQEFDAE